MLAVRAFYFIHPAIQTLFREALTLDLVKGKNTHGLHIVFKLGDLLIKEVCSNLVVFHHTRNLKLLDTITDWHKLGSAPDKPVSGNAADRLFQHLHVGLIIPWFHLQDDVTL